jgi:YjbE family integral membrane protein
MEMEFLTALLAIIMIDLVLAGDNAILIGLAARNLPKQQQKKVILWGSVGAIAIRVVATLAVVWLLEIPGLHLVGGLLLIIIAYKLLVDDGDHGDVKAGANFWAALRTVLIADTLMGLDNVLAVAGASHGNMTLVVLGLLISVPVVMWGSTIILKWIDRYPIIITIGAAILAWTASKMIVGEGFLSGIFTNGFVKYGFEILVIIAVIGIAKLKQAKNQKSKSEKSQKESVLAKTGSN